MSIKIVTGILAALLVVTLGAGAAFYLKMHKPLAEDYARTKSALALYEKDSAELKKLQQKERNEMAWTKPAIELLNAGLGDEIKSGNAEVFAAGALLVVNISERALFQPDSYTFAKESPQLRSDLAVLLKSDVLKGKAISIGNTAHAVPAQGRGRKKIPAKEARTLAAERSAVLIRDFEKNGVNPEALIAAAYSPKQPVMGYLIRDRKTVILIEKPPTAPLAAARQEAARQSFSKPAPDSKSTVTAPAPRPATETKPKPIPILPARPKTP